MERRLAVNGAACETITSLAFGDGLTTSGSCDPTALRFTGKQRDWESNLDYFGARYYSSQLGRFMSPDPDNAGEVDDDPQSWNAYPYVRNNPVTFTDPDGRACVSTDNGKTFHDDNSGGQTCAQASDPRQNNKASAVVDVSRDELNLLMLQSLGETLGSPRQWDDLAIHGMSYAMAFDGVLALPELASSLAPDAVDLSQLKQETGLSINSLKHIAKHLDEFKKLDSSITLKDIAKIGEDVKATGRQLGPKAWEKSVTIGNTTVTVRAVNNEIGSLRSVFIVK